MTPKSFVTPKTPIRLHTAESIIMQRKSRDNSLAVQSDYLSRWRVFHAVPGHWPHPRMNNTCFGLCFCTLPMTKDVRPRLVHQRKRLWLPVPADHVAHVWSADQLSAPKRVCYATEKPRIVNNAERNGFVQSRSVHYASRVAGDAPNGRFLVLV